jgi:hypothetical protein
MIFLIIWILIGASSFTFIWLKENFEFLDIDYFVLILSLGLGPFMLFVVFETLLDE